MKLRNFCKKLRFVSMVTEMFMRGKFPFRLFSDCPVFWMYHRPGEWKYDFFAFLTVLFCFVFFISWQNLAHLVIRLLTSMKAFFLKHFYAL